MAVFPTPGSPISTIREIAAVALQRLVGRLGVRTGHTLVSPNLLKGSQQSLAAQAVIAEQPSGTVRFVRDGQQQMLHADVFILQLLCRVFSPSEETGQLLRNVSLFRSSSRARDLRDPVQLALQLFLDSRQRNTRLTENGGHNTFRRLHQGCQQVLDIDPLMVSSRRQRLSLA
jgi:hypothetical protein